MQENDDERELPCLASNLVFLLLIMFDKPVSGSGLSNNVLKRTLRLVVKY